MGTDIESLLDQALAYASNTLENLTRENLSNEDILREAHMMKGMAGMLGLERLRKWAIDIEVGIDSQIIDAEISERLRSALEESRLAISELNFAVVNLGIR